MRSPAPERGRADRTATASRTGAEEEDGPEEAEEGWRETSTATTAAAAAVGGDGSPPSPAGGGSADGEEGGLGDDPGPFFLKKLIFPRPVGRGSGGMCGAWGRGAGRRMDLFSRAGRDVRAGA